jgi:hypothetical protein
VVEPSCDLVLRLIDPVRVGGLLVGGVGSVGVIGEAKDLAGSFIFSGGGAGLRSVGIEGERETGGGARMVEAGSEGARDIREGAGVTAVAGIRGCGGLTGMATTLLVAEGSSDSFRGSHFAR